MTEYKETLRRLALGDESFMESELGVSRTPRDVAARSEDPRPRLWSGDGD